MQSYGVESRFNRRTTLPYPTRSAVTGIFCAAMGIDRSDSAFLQKMAVLDIETLVLKRFISEEEPLRVANLMDYHTVGARYENVSEERQSGRLRRADGKSISKVEITYRDYLTDARFGVLVSGDDSLVERIDSALRNPVWGVWFGRKCCVPASPVAQGIYEERSAAIERLCSLAGCDRPERVIRDAKPGDEDVAVYRDMPVTFNRLSRGSGEEFGIRRIVVSEWDSDADQE